MIDNTTILYGGIAVLGGALIAWLLESKKAWWIVQEKLGKKYEVKKETGTFEKNKEFPVQYFDHKGNEILYSAHVKKSAGKYSLLDKSGVPFMETDRLKIITENYDDIVEGRAKCYRYTIADERYTASQNTRIDALILESVQKDNEIVERSLSTKHIEKQDAKRESDIRLIRNRGLRPMQHHGKPIRKHETSEASSEGEIEGGGQ